MNDIRAECKVDETIIRLKEQIKINWETPHTKIHNSISPFISMKDELTVDGHFVMKNNRKVIPRKLHDRVPNILHETHLGTTKSKQLARQSVFWPGINYQIYLIAITTCI